ncbi:hypothetical protein PAENIP36_00270 [Paenibacillus sp. P36]
MDERGTDDVESMEAELVLVDTTFRQGEFLSQKLDLGVVHYQLAYSHHRVHFVYYGTRSY